VGLWLVEESEKGNVAAGAAISVACLVIGARRSSEFPSHIVKTSRAYNRQ
jgi:hypothetical protein